jgi:5'-nucleotidase
MSYEQQRIAYSRTVVDLSEKNWVFLNTFFSISEACMYAQLVDLRDAKLLPEVHAKYADLYQAVRSVLDQAHAEGEMKAQIISSPEFFVVQRPRDPARAARPTRGRQAPDAHHELRVVVHPRDDDPRV